MAPEPLRWIDLSLPAPQENLEFDEQLLAAGEGVLRVWESVPYCIVMGRSGRADREVFAGACEAAEVPVLRRSSGGGTVLLGPGCLNYSLVLPLAWNPHWTDVRFSLDWVMQRICASLAVPGLHVEGICDLALDGRKVSGNAQRRAKHAFLHHGTLLYDFDFAQADRLLQQPERQPPYRGGRSHSDFLANLPLPALELKRRLREGWRL